MCFLHTMLLLFLEVVPTSVRTIAFWRAFTYFPLPKYREAVIKHSLVHKVFLDFFTHALPKQRSVSILYFLFSFPF